MSCFICSSELSERSSSGDQFCGGTHVGDIKDLAFVTRVVFQVPEEIVLGKLSRDGGYWRSSGGGDPVLQVEGISMCEACGESVEHAKTVYNYVVEGIQKFRKLQRRLVDKVRRGRRDTDEDDYLCFISSCDYPTSDDPFQIEEVESLAKVLLELPTHSSSNTSPPLPNSEVTGEEDFIDEEETPRDPLEMFQPEVNVKYEEVQFTANIEEEILEDVPESTFDQTGTEMDRLVPPIQTPQTSSRSSTRDRRTSRKRDSPREPWRSKICGECGKRCLQSAQLKTHLAVVHGIGVETRHVCETCGYGFLYTGDLNRHVRKFKGNCKPVTQRRIRQVKPS